MSIVNYVETFARKAHDGAFRNDGVTEYIVHPIAVSEIASDLIDERYFWIASVSDTEKRRLRKIVRILSLIHDIPEDVEMFKNQEEKIIQIIRSFDKKEEFSDFDYDYMTISLKNLNKNNFVSYLDFILNAKGVLASRIVKLADISHNLSDLKKGALRDKYQLSQFILEN